MPFAIKLVETLRSAWQVHQVVSAEDIPVGNEIAFLLSCERKVPKSVLERSRHNIVVHASDLPEGKGMSPLSWQILEGKNLIPLTLFEAIEAIDAGPFYLKENVSFSGNELLDEMRLALGNKIVEMCTRFVREYPQIIGKAQPQIGPETFYPRRRQEDSRLDAEKTIAAQFNLLRIADNERYPAFFEWKGRVYLLKITAAK